MVEFNIIDQHNITDHAVVWGRAALVTLSLTSVSAMLSRSFYCPAVQELCRAFGEMAISQFSVVIAVPIEVPTEARSCAAIYLWYS